MAALIKRFERLEASAALAASQLIDREPLLSTDADFLAIARHEVLAHVILNEKLNAPSWNEDEASPRSSRLARSPTRSLQ